MNKCFICNERVLISKSSTQSHGYINPKYAYKGGHYHFECMYKSITKKVKAQVYARDEGKCVVCGRYYPLQRIPHHAFFRSEYFKENRNGLWNLCLLCLFCDDLVHHNYKNEEIEENGREIDLKLKKIALGRYKGEHREILEKIWASKDYKKVE